MNTNITINIKKKATAVITSCLMVFSIFAGFNTISPVEVSADAGWELINANDQTVDFQYREVEPSPYYDGTEHQMLEFGLEYEKVVFQRLSVTLKNRSTGEVIDEISYTNPTPTTVNAAGIAKKDELLQQINSMTKQTKTGNYSIVVNYGIGQKQYQGVANSVGSGFTKYFSVLPRPIEIVTGSATKTYDGKALTKSGYTYNQTLDDQTASLLPGDKLNVTVTGSQTAVGESDNTAKAKVLDSAGNDVSKNYKFTVKAGKLNVSKAIAPQSIVKLNILRSPAASATAIKLQWNPVAGATGYKIYATKCGHAFKYMKTITGKSNTTYTVKGLKNGEVYKYYVKAYKKVSGKVKYIYKTNEIHVATTASKYSNAKSVKANFTKATLKKGATKQLKGSVTLINKNKKVLNHVAKVRFLSSNTKIATVTSKGVIKAKAAGKCYVCVYASNGIYKAALITVK